MTDRKTSSSRMPYAAPDAPLMPMMLVPRDPFAVSLVRWEVRVAVDKLPGSVDLSEDLRNAPNELRKRQMAAMCEPNSSTRYARRGQSQDWRLAAGFVDSRPAILVRHPDDPLHRVRYFILLDWTDGRVTRIRDFIHAQYVVEAADIIELR
jgi:hypothetical protein